MFIKGLYEATGSMRKIGLILMCQGFQWKDTEGSEIVQEAVLGEKDLSYDGGHRNGGSRANEEEVSRRELISLCLSGFKQ